MFSFPRFLEEIINVGIDPGNSAIWMPEKHVGDTSGKAMAYRCACWWLKGCTGVDLVKFLVFHHQKSFYISRKSVAGKYPEHKALLTVEREENTGKPLSS